MMGPGRVLPKARLNTASMGKTRFSPCQKRILAIRWGSHCPCTLLCAIPPQPCPTSLLGDDFCQDKQNHCFNPVTNTDNWNQEICFANTLFHGKSITRLLRMKIHWKEQNTQVHGKKKKHEGTVLKITAYQNTQTNKSRFCIGDSRMVLKILLESFKHFKIWS